jgi:hypothetical protein
MSPRCRSEAATSPTAKCAGSLNTAIDRACDLRSDMVIDAPRRFTTELISTDAEHKLRVVSIPSRGDQVNELLGAVRSRVQLTTIDIEHSELPNGRLRTLEEVGFRRGYPLPELWEANPVADFFAQASGASDAQRLVRETLTSGLIVMEASPPRLRRLVTVPLLSVWGVAAHFHPATLLEMLGGIVLLELTTSLVVPTADYLSEQVDEWWRRESRRPRDR